MVAHGIGQSPVEDDHTHWREDHLVWAGEVQVWERTIDAALFDVELALWDKQFAKLDHGSPLDALERMYTALNDLAAALREHGDKIREHEAALIQHQRQVATAPSSDSSDAAVSRHLIMAVVHNEQCAFRERFRECFDATLCKLRSLLESRSGAH
jgi:hypothetical protein